MVLKFWGCGVNNEFKAGNRVHVDFLSENHTEFSGKKIEGEGVIDRAEDGYVYGRLDSGQTFMCSEADVVVINDDAETEFKKWIEVSPEYQTLVFQHGERLFIRRNGQYEILSVRLARRLWAMIEGHRFTINAMGEVLVEKDNRIKEALSLIQAWNDQGYRDDAEQLINVDLVEALRGEHE